MQWLFVAILNGIIGFLESSFQQDPTSTQNDDDFFSSSPRDGPADDKADQRLAQAYEFMELKPPVTHAELKKQFKKLSLRYHPDRNGSSQESHDLMQRLNASVELIEKELTGVTEDDDNTDEDERDRDEGETPRECYERMQAEMYAEMKAELKRKAEQKRDFNQKRREESVRNHKTSKAMKLGTEEGRERANEIFINQVEAQKRAKEQAQNTTTGASPTSESMDSIDEHDIAPEEHNTPDTPLEMKPTNFVMDCNIQKIAQALRMGLPDVAIPLLQENLQQFAAQKSQDMYFEGVNKTLPELRLEFLLQSMDLDDNTILHYAVYYESYQVVASLTHVAKEDGTLQEVLSHPNIHGQTPIWFAEIAQDDSIRHLINSRVELAEKLLQQSQFGPAFKAGMARLWQAVLHISVPYILSTLLSFYLGHIIFGEHFVTCLASLVAMQYLGDDHWLGSPQSFTRVPGIRGVVILVSGLGLWEMLKWLVRFVLRHVMWELLLILAPFMLAAMCSGRRGARRGALWIYPLRAYFFTCDRLEHGLTILHRYTTPKIVARRRDRVRLYFLSLVVILSLGIQHLGAGAVLP